MRIEEYKSLFDFDQYYSIEEIKNILLDNGICEEQIAIEDYNVLVKKAYKNTILCINLSLPIINEIYSIKSIYFIPITIHLADINNPYDYYIRK